MISEYIMKLLIFFLLISINLPCFGFPSIEKDPLHDRYSNDISKITEIYDKFTIAYVNGINDFVRYVSQKEIIELKNGLFIINEYSNKDPLSQYRAVICYNLYNKQTESEIRLMEIMTIYDYEINYLENGIEIVTSRSKQTRDERGYIDYLIQKITIIFEFDLSNKIDHYNIIDQDGNEILENYLFHYNNNGKLDSIHMIYNGNIVLYKSIFYDGQLRTLRHPFFNDLQNSNIVEIIILDDNKLKYHLKRYFYVSYFDHIPRVPEDFLINDKYYYSYLIEFGENGNQIKQVNYFEAGGDEYNVEYLQYDEKGNWLLMKIKNDKYRREIEYK
jgi:hypothetical protein